MVSLLPEILFSEGKRSWLKESLLGDRLTSLALGHIVSEPSRASFGEFSWLIRLRTILWEYIWVSWRFGLS